MEENMERQRPPKTAGEPRLVCRLVVFVPAARLWKVLSATRTLLDTLRRYDIIDTKNHGRRFRRRLYHLLLHPKRVKDVQLLHVLDLARVNVNAEPGVSLPLMFRPELHQYVNRVQTGIFGQGSRHSLQSFRESLNRQLLPASHLYSVLSKPLGQLSFRGTSTGENFTILQGIPDHAQRVVQ